MYQYESKDYAGEFFTTQENLATARTNRAIAQAQERRTQSEFERTTSVRAIADQTLQNLAKIGSGQYNTTEAATTELAMDALGTKNPTDSLVKSGVMIDEKPRSIDMEPIDLTVGTMADAVGNALMRAGYGAEGMAYAKEGIDYVNKVAEAEQKQAKARIEQAKSFVETADFVYEGLADVRSQEDQDRFFASLPESIVKTLGVENVKNMASIPFTPEVIEHYREKALSTKDTYDLSLRAEAQQLTADRDAALAFDRAARTKIAQQRLQEERARREATAKGGGKAGALIATPAAISQAHTKIVADVFKGRMPAKGSPDDVIIRSAAASIASEATQMAKDNPGLTYDQALERAVTLHRGDFIQPIKEEDSLLDGLLGRTPKKVKNGPLQYKPRGSSKDRPIVIQDRSKVKLVPGKWYSAGGRVMQYNP